MGFENVHALDSPFDYPIFLFSQTAVVLNAVYYLFPPGFPFIFRPGSSTFFTRMHLPAPPVLKTTIIQLNKDIDPEDNNYEILTKEYSNSSATPMATTSLSLSISEEQPRKKRRRSSSFVDDEELARRRNETKQLHSIIEKRRRIKINREFEALKYLIPACRNTDNSTKRNAASNNSSKIDGMYKLTILKSAVEYILYLHHIVQKQHHLLKDLVDHYDYDVAYSTAPLDVNQYRNIDKEFNFSELGSKASELAASTSQRTRFESITEHEPLEYQRPKSRQPVRTVGPTSHPRANSDSVATVRSSQLPTPDVTPDIAPILSLLSRYSDQQQTLPSQAQTIPAGRLSKSLSNSLSNSSANIQEQGLPTRMEAGSSGGSSHTFYLQHDIDTLNKTFLFDSSMHKSGSVSSSTSPFTIPIKSQVKRGAFYLPDPALSGNSSSVSSTSELPTVGAAQALPKKMYFKSKVPPTNVVVNGGLTDAEMEVDEEMTEGDRLEDASKTLLTLRKPSIDRLLN